MFFLEERSIILLIIKHITAIMDMRAVYPGQISIGRCKVDHARFRVGAEEGIESFDNRSILDMKGGGLCVQYAWS